MMYVSVYTRAPGCVYLIPCLLLYLPSYNIPGMGYQVPGMVYFVDEGHEFECHSSCGKVRVFVFQGTTTSK